MLADLAGLVDTRCLDAARDLVLPKKFDALTPRASLYPADDGCISIIWRYWDKSVEAILLADGQTLRITVKDRSRVFHAPFNQHDLFFVVTAGFHDP